MDMTSPQDEHSSTGWIADDQSFGARLALIRQRMQWGNVKEAAVACGLPAESWRTWERDGVVPRKIVEIAEVIADKSGCNYIWLLTGRHPEGRLLRVVGEEVSRKARDTRYYPVPPIGQATPPTADSAGRAPLRSAPPDVPVMSRRPAKVRRAERPTAL